jgi:hypothetical protein
MLVHEAMTPQAEWVDPEIPLHRRHGACATTTSAACRSAKMIA